MSAIGYTWHDGSVARTVRFPRGGKALPGSNNPAQAVRGAHLWFLNLLAFAAWRFPRQAASGLRAEIGLVADQMLPIMTLPNRAFAAPQAHCRKQFGFGNGFGEKNFDQAPACRKISIARRKFDHAMQMIG